MAEQQRGDSRRIEYFMPIDQENIDIVNQKKMCSELLGDLYALANIGKADMRGEAEFKGKLLTLFRLIQGKMLKSEIKDFVESDKTDAEGKPLKIEFYKYQELARVIDEEFKRGFDMDTGEVILKRMLEFIEESGILLKNIPRYI